MYGETSLGFPGGSEVKNPPANAGDMGSIPGSGRYPGEGNVYPLWYSWLENSIDRGAWQAIVHGIAGSDMTNNSNNNKTSLLHTWAAHIWNSSMTSVRANKDIF